MQRPSVPTNTAEKLKGIVREWPTVINERDLDFSSPKGQRIKACIASDFSAVLDGYADKLTWAQLLGVWEQQYKDFPECWLSLVGCHADVNEGQGVAEVFLDMDMQFEKGIELKAYTRLAWTRDEDGRWFIRSFHGMRGYSGGTGFV